MIIIRLTDDNYPTYVTLANMIPRFVTPLIETALTDTPVVLLNGARQTGKSTLVKSICTNLKEATYLNLDEVQVLASLAADPIEALSAHKGTIVIDEVQRLPELFLPLKVLVDRQRSPGRFLLTGSANVLLLPRLADSLAGRMEIHNLWPFSQGELIGKQESFITDISKDNLPYEALSHATASRAQILERALLGGYPEIHLKKDKSRTGTWFDSYVSTIILKDVRDIRNAESLTALPTLLRHLAARSGGLINFAEISRVSAIPQTTLKGYISIFEMLFLIKLLPPWFANVGQRLIKAPKLYFCDSGVLTHLLKLNPEKIQLDGTLAGPLLENFVLMELIKQLTWIGPGYEIYHFRTAAGQEVDFVIEEPDGRLLGIEVKAGTIVGEHDFAGLRQLSNLAGKRFHRGIVLYTGNQVLPFGAHFCALPLATLWL